MNKFDVLAKLEYFNMVHGVTLRAIATLSDEDLDFLPRPNMRSPRELIFHNLHTREDTRRSCADWKVYHGSGLPFEPGR